MRRSSQYHCHPSVNERKKCMKRCGLDWKPVPCLFSRDGLPDCQSREQPEPSEWQISHEASGPGHAGLNTGLVRRPGPFWPSSWPTSRPLSWQIPSQVLLLPHLQVDLRQTDGWLFLLQHWRSHFSRWINLVIAARNLSPSVYTKLRTRERSVVL